MEEGSKEKEVDRKKEVDIKKEVDREKGVDKDRPSWKNYFSKICKVTSERSACERLKVGCLLVKDNRIISQGYGFYLVVP